MSEKEVVTVAKVQSIPDIFEIYGTKIRLIAVPVGIVQDSLIQLIPPKAPMFYDEDKDREYENPNDPDYLNDVAMYDQKRGVVTTEAFCMFGIELLDGLPKDDAWLKRLKFMHKKGTLDLSWVDWDDETDVEFLFKRYVVGTTEVITTISQKTAVTSEAVAQAKTGFQR